MAGQTFAIQFAPETHDHIAAIERKYHRQIRDTIDQKLAHDPTVPTRNRKRLRLPVPFSATWELRFGPRNRFRVFYDVDEEKLVVTILGVARKEGNRIVAGKEELD